MKKCEVLVTEKVNHYKSWLNQLTKGSVIESKGHKNLMESQLVVKMAIIIKRFYFFPPLRLLSFKVQICSNFCAWQCFIIIIMFVISFKFYHSYLRSL